uniref:SXP/RAL-2 family protein Ani s 5-like cation-binding domain-containing protein n=1 Tax=Meloidogyne floridensis TaxID=298350 RepID=A0A915NCF7_9BILA
MQVLSTILFILQCVFVVGMEHGEGSNNGIKKDVGQSSGHASGQGNIYPAYLPSGLPDFVHYIRPIPKPLDELNKDLPNSPQYININITNIVEQFNKFHDTIEHYKAELFKIEEKLQIEAIYFPNSEDYDKLMEGKMKNLAHQNKLKNDMWKIYNHVYNLGQPG